MNQLSAEIGQSFPDFLYSVDVRRLAANQKLDPKTKSAQGQFMTPVDVATFMASFFKTPDIGEVRLLDAGAGVGSLTAAFVERFVKCGFRLNSIKATLYESDPFLADHLKYTLAECMNLGLESGVSVVPELRERDFIEAGMELLKPNLLSTEKQRKGFTHAILNPPYKKIRNASRQRQQLRAVGIETSNLYAGFLALTIKLLQPGGEMVAIVPRSFCNGPYFKPFRQLLLSEMALLHMHVFESRTEAFKEDAVLQENVVFHAAKGCPQGRVTLSVSKGARFDDMRTRTVDFKQIVNPRDPDSFIHIVVNEDDQCLVDQMNALPCRLEDLGIDASTGPVVDFRLKKFLRAQPGKDTVPLIYPVHCRNNVVEWPAANTKKPNAIIDAEPVQKWLYPNGYYAVVRRFSSKEERRRVVAAVHDPTQVEAARIGFENHVNVFHAKRRSLSPALARGLAVYLNSTFYDVCFRQFNGHTQVNVRDLYNLRYPARNVLECLGERAGSEGFPDQQTVDAWVDEVLRA